MKSTQGTPQGPRCAVASRLIVIVLTSLFAAIAAAQIFVEKAPVIGTRGAVIVLCAGLAARTSRVGIWANESIVVFRSFWRTLKVSRMERRIRVVPYESFWTWGNMPWFFSMLAIEYRGREANLAFTLARRKSLQRLVSTLRRSDPDFRGEPPLQ